MPDAAAGRVSAIIIFLDAARFLREAIESVLAQDAPVLELLLVDDGSRDEGPAIAQSYVDANPDRVRLLRHPGGTNRGMSASRNLGVADARGEFVAFVDADDLWLPHKTREQLALFDAHAVDMVYGRTLLWHSWNPDDRSADDYCPLGVEPDAAYAPPRLFANLVANRYQTPTTCNAMIRRSAWLALGGFEEAFRGMYEDQAFFARFHLEYRTWVSDRTWAWYRQHAGNSGQPFSQANYHRERRQLLDFVWRHARRRWNLLDQRSRDLLRVERLLARYPLLAALARLQGDVGPAERLRLARQAGWAWRRAERRPAVGTIDQRRS